MNARRIAATWGAPLLVSALGAALYIAYSVAQWRSLAAPSWDLAIFTQAARAYSQFQAPIVPIKGPGYNLLGDHFHPILVLLGPIYRLFPSALTLLVVQDLLIALSALPITRQAVRTLGNAGGVAVGIPYVLAWGFQGAVAAQFHEIAFAVPLLAFGGVAFVRGRWGACMAWLAPLVLVKEDLGLTVLMAGLAMAVRRRSEGKRALASSLGFALFGAVAFILTVSVLLPAVNAAGTWAYSLDGSATGAGSTTGGAQAKVWPSLVEIVTFPSVKMVTLFILAATAGFIGLASPWALLALPTLAWRFAGSVDFYYDWQNWHYNAVLIPIMVCALLDVASRTLEREEGKADRLPLMPRLTPTLARTGVFVPVLVMIITAPLLPLWRLPAMSESPRMADALAAISAIPEGASVESDATLLARLAEKREAYWVGSSGINPEYVLVDTRSYAWGGKEVNAVQWATSTRGGTYEMVFDSGGFQVARRIG